MQNQVQINCKYGSIKGTWSSDGLKQYFIGKLFKDDESILDIDFSVPYSFMQKYGHQSVLDEIKNSVEGYLDTEKNA